MKTNIFFYLILMTLTHLLLVSSFKCVQGWSYSSTSWIASVIYILLLLGFCLFFLFFLALQNLSLPEIYKWQISARLFLKISWQHAADIQWLFTLWSVCWRNVKCLYWLILNEWTTLYWQTSGLCVRGQLYFILSEGGKKKFYIPPFFSVRGVWWKNVYTENFCMHRLNSVRLWCLKCYEKYFE